MSRSRAKGTAWETAIVDYLRTNGVPHAERRASNGANKDRGDVAGLPGIVLEAKSATRLELAAWLDEAEQERINAAAAIAAVWVKRRGRTSPGAGYVLLSGATLVRLLTEAGYIPQLAPPDRAAALDRGRAGLSNHAPTEDT